MTTPSSIDSAPAARKLEVAPGIFIEMAQVRWSKRDRASLFVPARARPADWAVGHRYLTKTALPGPWRHENAPYLRGIMNLGAARGVEELCIKKAAQMGVSEAIRTLIGYWAHLDPEPVGLALPSEKKGREIVENELIPFFRNEFGRLRELRELLPSRMHDIKKGQIRLANGFLMHLMWSGSPASMASNPMKRAACDEVDKFQAWAGNDADPVSLIEVRMRTYPDRLLLLVSTPTTPEGPISTHFDQVHHKLYYLVPCPHCGVRQRMIFGSGGDHGVKWSEGVRALYKAGKREEAAALALSEGVWYECVACHGRWDERQKRAAVRAGIWGTVGGDDLTADDRIIDAEAVREWPRGTKLGMQIGSLCCCWESWTMAHVAAEFLAARALAQFFAFRTSTLGETWAQATGEVQVEVIDERVKQARLGEGILPRWTGRLLAAVDTQKDHFWLVIRAWGPGLLSQRIWHGRVETFADLEQWTMKTPWASEDPRIAARVCDKVFIDSGGTKKHLEEQLAGTPLPSRVMDVYAWALKHSALVQAIKGDARPDPGQYIKRTKGEFVHERQKRPVPLLLLDVGHFQDQLADLMNHKRKIVDVRTGEETEVDLWQLNSRADPEYQRHMSNMHKVTVSGRGGRSEHWEPKREGLRVDYRAAEGYLVAGAFHTGVHLLPEYAVYLQAVEAEIERRLAPPVAQTPAMTTPDGRAFLASRR